MKNFLKILIILLTVLFFSLIVTSVKYISYKNSYYEIETEVPESIEDLKDDILINVGKIKAIPVIENRVSYKLQNNKKKYHMINVSTNINSLCDFLDKDATNDAFANVLSYSKLDKSKLDGETSVYNFDDIIGMLFVNGYLEKIEVYDKESVFVADSGLNTFKEIVNEFGLGTFIVCDEGTFVSYKMIYTYKNNLVTFTSFYEDGRCNVCEIENIDRN